MILYQAAMVFDLSDSQRASKNTTLKTNGGKYTPALTAEASLKSIIKKYQNCGSCHRLESPLSLKEKKNPSSSDFSSSFSCPPTVVLT